MKIRSFIFALCFISSGTVQGKMKNAFTDSCFSKKNLLDDLAFLDSTVHTYCAFLPLLEHRSNIKVDYEFDKLRSIIDSDNTPEKYVGIIDKALSVLNDKHSHIINKSSLISLLKYNDMGKLGNTKLSDTLYADYYCSLVTDSIQKKARTGIRTKYINGKYYNTRPFTYRGEAIKAGEQITAIDNIPIDEFINNNRYSLYNLLWDPINKQWYDDYFMMALPQLGKQIFTLKIGNRNVKLDSNITVDNLQKEHFVTDKPQVMILDNTILYIRMPVMFNAEWYLQKISEIYTPDITKIIFDVRSNPGGSDGVWHEILRNLIDKPLTYSRMIGINNNEESKNINKLSNYDRDKNGNVNMQHLIYPENDSFHFKGKYYVLQDKYSYSAASALSSLAWQKDEIKLIGEPSAFINGYQMPPLMFTLPHSRITFNLGYAVDLSGGEQNPYMDKVEKIVSENIDEYLERVLYYDSYSYEYLNYKDKFIKAVIED